MSNVVKNIIENSNLVNALGYESFYLKKFEPGLLKDNTGKVVADDLVGIFEPYNSSQELGLAEMMGSRLFAKDEKLHLVPTRQLVKSPSEAELQPKLPSKTIRCSFVIVKTVINGEVFYELRIGSAGANTHPQLIRKSLSENDKETVVAGGELVLTEDGKVLLVTDNTGTFNKKLKQKGISQRHVCDLFFKNYYALTNENNEKEGFFDYSHAFDQEIKKYNAKNNTNLTETELSSNVREEITKNTNKVLDAEIEKRTRLYQERFSPKNENVAFVQQQTQITTSPSFLLNSLRRCSIDATVYDPNKDDPMESEQTEEIPFLNQQASQVLKALRHSDSSSIGSDSSEESTNSKKEVEMSPEEFLHNPVNASTVTKPKKMKIADLIRARSSSSPEFFQRKPEEQSNTPEKRKRGDSPQKPEKKSNSLQNNSLPNNSFKSNSFKN